MTGRGDTSARSLFVARSVQLTGHTPAELEATGRIDRYLSAVNEVVGEEIMALVLDPERSTDDVLADDTTGPVARNLIVLWYLGQWDQLPPEWRNEHGAHPEDVSKILSADAFKEGLVWSVIGSHPPAAKQPGFGSWSLPPRGLAGGHETAVEL